MRIPAWILLLAAFCLFSPPTLLAQRLSIAPPTVTIMEGNSGEITVMLSSEPTGNVTVTIVKSIGTEVRLNKTELTFTPSNWNVGQTVTLTAGEDEDITDDDGTLILIARGGGYDEDGVIIRPEMVTIDSPGKSVQLSAAIEDQDRQSVTGVSFDWSSADLSVAVVDSAGKITAVNSGTTTITAALAAVPETVTISGKATVRVASGITDREVLVALYNATDGPNWVNNQFWLTNSPLERWYGVTTDRDGRVIDISLGGRLDDEDRFVSNGLTGSIPPELGSLSNLRILNLSNNRLTGPIPPELGGLANLHTLDLSVNKLTGVVPSELGVLVNLTQLDLKSNELSGTIPPSLQQLRFLRQFHVSENSGLCVPDVLVVWYRRLLDPKGSFCPDREVLRALYETAGGDGWTNTTGWLTRDPLAEWYGVEMGQSGRVSTVNLAGNGLSGRLPQRLGELADLTVLRIEDNALTGHLPPSLSRTPLQELRYANTGLCVPAAESFQTWLAGIPSHESNEEECVLLSEREILETVYHETNGPSWENSENWLTDAPLGQWHGVRTNRDGRVVILDLQLNNLNGSIPPELGTLSRLEELNLLYNELTSVPAELGKLTQLRYLFLGINQLTSIPPELGQLENLQTLVLDHNQLNSIPEELNALNALELLFLDRNRLTSFPLRPDGFPVLKVLDLSLNEFTSFPLELGKLDSLQILELDGNRIGDIPPGLGRVAGAKQIVSYSARKPSILEKWSESGSPSGPNSNEDRFASISQKLDRWNDLWTRMTGDANPALAVRAQPSVFPKLWAIDLSSNELSGPLPEGLLGLTGLGSLGLNDNARLSGPLPLGLTALEQLKGLHTSGTGLCAPADPEFLDWLDGVILQRVVHCEQGENTTAYLTQAVQSREFPVPLVAGEPALLRVFLTAVSAFANMPPVRATFYRNETVIHRVEIPGTSHFIPTQIDESSLSKSVNVEIPGQIIQPGLEVVIEPDPDGMLDPALGVVRRIPAEGRMAIDVREMPVFEVTLVPFLWQQSPDPSVIETVTAMAADPQGHEMFERTHLLLPISEISATAHESVVTSTNSMFDLLQELEMIRVAEDNSGHYLGFMAPPTEPSQLLGIAFDIGSWSSMSILDSEIIAHEFGHNRALFHAPCGDAGGPDRFYPYEKGNIGVWGYDFDTRDLVPPSQKDFMTYCEPTWTSDYQFTNAVRYRLETETESDPIAAADIAQAATGRTLMLWGGLDGNGEPYLKPSFFIDTRPTLPEADGPWSLTGTDEAGAVLFSLSFAMSEFTDIDSQHAGFSFAVPVTWTEELATITLQGPSGSASLDRDTNQPMTILRNATTGQIRGILDGVLEATALDMVTIGDEDTQNIQVLFSRGIPDPTDVRQ